MTETHDEVLERYFNLADQTLKALDLLGGFYEDDPGTVLAGLTTLVCGGAHNSGTTEYKQISKVVLALENFEMIEVQRQSKPEAGQSNRVISVRIIN